MILVTDYLRNDIDGVACIYAYSEFLNKKGIDAAGTIFGKPHSESQFVIDKLKLKMLGCAIISNTVNFKAGVTTKRDPARHSSGLIQRRRYPKASYTRCLSTSRNSPNRFRKP